MVVPYMSPQVSRNNIYEDFDNFGNSLTNYRYSKNKLK